MACGTLVSRLGIRPEPLASLDPQGSPKSFFFKKKKKNNTSYNDGRVFFFFLKEEGMRVKVGN